MTVSRIGIACKPDHPVFSRVGRALRERGFGVSYVDPTDPIDRSALADLSLFVSKHTRPASVRALIEAERLGVCTWNSATGVLACVTRFSQLCALSGVGFAVPNASRTKPQGEYVAKSLYHWGSPPTVNGEGDVYEALLPAEPVDYKYYVVDDGTEYRSTVLRTTSKLFGEKRVLDRTTPVSDHVDRIVDLMDRLEMRAIGVDLVRADGQWYAVDLNPCPGFSETGLEAALVDSIMSSAEREESP